MSVPVPPTNPDDASKDPVGTLRQTPEGAVYHKATLGWRWICAPRECARSFDEWIHDNKASHYPRVGALPTIPADERLSLHGLAMAAYAAAHDIEPHQVDTTDGSFNDVADVLRRYIEAGTSDLAVALGLPADTDDPEITEVLEGLYREIDRLRDKLDEERQANSHETGHLDADRECMVQEIQRLRAERDAALDDLRYRANIPDGVKPLIRDELEKAHRFGIEGRTYGPDQTAQELIVKLRPSVSDQTPTTPDDSHGVRRLIVHPATWDGLVRFLDVRGIEVTPYPDEDGIPTFGMGIKWLPLPSSIQDDTERCGHRSVWKGCARIKGHDGGGHSTYPLTEEDKRAAQARKTTNPAPSSVQGDTTPPHEVDLLRQAAKAAREHGNELRADVFEVAAKDHEDDDCPKGERAECMAVELARKALAEYASSAPSEGDPR